jgi:mono/diheme cytochrome c family protein
MKRPSAIALFVGAAVIGAGALWTATTSAAAQPAPAAPPAEADAAARTKAIFEAQCSNCHELRIVTGQRKTEEEWATTVDAMVAKGAPVTPEQADEIIAYLAKYYGPNSN